MRALLTPAAIGFLLFLGARHTPAPAAGRGETAATAAPPATIRVAVAANFAACLQDLADAFTTATGVAVQASSASTGVLYAQIRAGAPFDVLLAADAERPRLLVEEGLAVGDTRFTYAVGRLVLWCPDGAGGWRDGVPADSLATLLRSILDDDVRPLAAAAPHLAPYGRAAAEVLAALGLDPADEGRLALGLNVGQTWQHTATGAASAGFVALSQVRAAEKRDPDRRPGLAVLVPADLHAPVAQQAVLLTRAAEAAAARGFLDFLAGEAARPLLAAYGYERPAP